MPHFRIQNVSHHSPQHFLNFRPDPHGQGLLISPSWIIHLRIGCEVNKMYRLEFFRRVTGIGLAVVADTINGRSRFTPEWGVSIGTISPLSRPTDRALQANIPFVINTHIPPPIRIRVRTRPRVASMFMSTSWHSLSEKNTRNLSACTPVLW